MQIDIESGVVSLPSLHLQANGSGLSLSRQKPAHPQPPTPHTQTSELLKIGSDPQCERTWRMSHKWRRWIGAGPRLDSGQEASRCATAEESRGCDRLRRWRRCLLSSWVEHWRTEINPPVHLCLADHDLVTLKRCDKRKGFKETNELNEFESISIPVVPV